MTAANAIFFSTPQRKVNERSSVVIIARFRDRATNADVTPTNVKYRLDGAIGEIVGWTTATPGTTVSITLTSDNNQIYNDTRRLESRTLSVAADYGLATEFRESTKYEVRNRPYFT